MVRSWPSLVPLILIRSFKAEVYVLSKEEGGRHTPFFKGYRPQFYFRTTDVTGDIVLPDGVEMVMPGDNITMDVHPYYSYCHGAAHAFCNSRRRTNRWCGSCYRDCRVTYIYLRARV